MEEVKVYFKIEEKFANKILEYLLSKPCKEVFEFVNEMMYLEKIEDKKEVEKAVNV
jgi:hypothetical protein